jgi:hypothetical protein
MGGLAHPTRQEGVERNYSSLVGHGPFETYFHYQSYGIIFVAYILYYTLSVPMIMDLGV